MISLKNALAKSTDFTALSKQLDAIAAIRAEVPVPALEAAIAAIEHTYECELHSSLRHQLGRWNGSRVKKSRVTFRPMSCTEILDLHSYWKQLGGVIRESKVIFCWTNDNSDYLGVSCEGLLSGTVTLFSHESPCWAPQFRSLSEALDSILDETFESTLVGDRPGTFPLFLNDVSQDDLDFTSRCCQHFLERAQVQGTDDERRQYLETAMFVVYPQRYDQMIQFLSVEDIWIPATAANFLGKRRLREAIGPLGALVRRGKPNGDIAAARALGAIGTKEAENELMRSKRGASPDLTKWIDRILTKLH